MNLCILLSMFRSMHRKHPVHHRHPSARAFAHMALLVGTGNAAFWTIFPLILEDAVGGSYALVGVYYSLIAVATFIASIGSSYLFRSFSKVWITKLMLVLTIVFLVLMTGAEHVYHLGILDIPRSVCVLLVNIALSLFIRDVSTRENLAIAEGRYYFFSNIGWLIGPIVAGGIAAHHGNESMFILVSLMFLIALLYFAQLHFVVKHPHLHHEKQSEHLHELTHTIVEYFQNKERIKVFLVALGLNFWWVVSSIYIPLTVEELGFNQQVIGWVVTGGIVPLILLEEWVGRRAARSGVRLYLIIGFILLGLIAMSFPLFYSLPVALLVLLAAVNVGAAFIEPLQETYFFEVSHRKKDADRFFGIYSTAEPVSNFIAPLFASSALVFGMGIAGVWLASGILLLVFAVVCVTIKKKY